MDFSIAALLAQDGLTNGAIYRLLALALVLVFAVTRVIFVPQGEFVAFTVLTLAAFEQNKLPGTVWLLLALGVTAAVAEVLTYRSDVRRMLRAMAGSALPSMVAAALVWARACHAGGFSAAGAGNGAGSHRDGAGRVSAGVPAGGDGAGADAPDRFGRGSLRADRARPAVLLAQKAPAPQRSPTRHSASVASTSPGRACWSTLHRRAGGGDGLFFKYTLFGRRCAPRPRTALAPAWSASAPTSPAA